MSARTRRDNRQHVRLRKQQKKDSGKKRQKRERSQPVAEIRAEAEAVEVTDEEVEDGRIAAVSTRGSHSTNHRSL
jgi:hypothetical protein